MPSPSFSPVAPSLKYVFSLSCELEEPDLVGDSGEGRRVIVPLGDGHIESAEIAGLHGAKLMKGGADFLRFDSNGTAKPDARYHLQLPSGHYLYVQSSGVRMVLDAPDADQTKKKLLEMKEVDPKKYYFRLRLILETDDPDPQVQYLASRIIIASAVRGPNSIAYDAYVVE